MDAKITLKFDEHIIMKAKKFADEQNISLSRLTEFLYRRMTNSNVRTLEEIPIANWVHMVAEGEVEYHAKKKSRKAMKNEYFKSKR